MPRFFAPQAVQSTQQKPASVQAPKPPALEKASKAPDDDICIVDEPQASSATKQSSKAPSPATISVGNNTSLSTDQVTVGLLRQKRMQARSKYHQQEAPVDVEEIQDDDIVVDNGNTNADTAVAEEQPAIDAPLDKDVVNVLEASSHISEIDKPEAPKSTLNYHQELTENMADVLDELNDDASAGAAAKEGERVDQNQIELDASTIE